MFDFFEELVLPILALIFVCAMGWFIAIPLVHWAAQWAQYWLK